MQILKAFGQVLKEERVRQNLSQEKLAELTDLSRSYIYYLERGVKNPTMTTQLSICKALNISIEALMEKVNNKVNELEKDK